MGYKRKKRTARRHFVRWWFLFSGSFQPTHNHFSGSKSETYQEMHPTLDDSRVSSTMQGSVQSIAKQRLKHAHFIILPAIRGRLKAQSGSNTAYYHQTENMKTPIHRAHSAQ